jgi:hypothetical protein
MNQHHFIVKWRMKNALPIPGFFEDFCAFALVA